MLGHKAYRWRGQLSICKCLLFGARANVTGLQTDWAEYPGVPLEPVLIGLVFSSDVGCCGAEG